MFILILICINLLVILCKFQKKVSKLKVKTADLCYELLQKIRSLLPLIDTVLCVQIRGPQPLDCSPFTASANDFDTENTVLVL